MSKMKLTRRAFSYPYILFMMIFVVLPLVLILVNAFMANGELTFKNFVNFFSDGSSIHTLLISLAVGFITTSICLFLGYPIAYLLTKRKSGRYMVLLFTLPMWVNFLLRTLATKEIFQALNMPLGMATVIIGMVYNYLPFMIMPLYTSLSNIDKSYAEAAQDLGANSLGVFLNTTLPLSVPGIVSGITMVFIPTISTFAISELLSDRMITLFGDSINLKFTQDMYGVGSVMSLVMIILVILSNVLMSKADKGTKSGGAV
ncbi:MAG: ABC transporter permease [Clostridia bacterium]|nr:ABC transporter permease [Clostridia bacterium]